MSQTTRAFFALIPDDDGLDFLSNRIQLFRAKGWERFGRFVESDSLHVTMRFLGDVTDEKLEEIQSAATELGSSSKPFDYEVSRACLFPRVSRARIVAAKINATPEMRQFARKLEDLSLAAGLKPEARMFRPHVTMARLKQGQKRPNLPSRPGAITQKAEKLHLMESKVGEFGATYREIAVFPLAG